MHQPHCQPSRWGPHDVLSGLRKRFAAKAIFAFKGSTVFVISVFVLCTNHIAYSPSVTAQTVPSQQPNSNQSPDPILTMLLSRVESEPTHGDTWRLIAKRHLQNGDTPQGLKSLHRAVTVEPDCTAAHHDLGMLLLELERTDDATHHFEMVFDLAPQSSYADQLRQRGIKPLRVMPGQSLNTALAAPFDDTEFGLSPLAESLVVPVSYQIQTFDGVDSLDPALAAFSPAPVSTQKPVRFFVEAGLLYNSNLSLTPISRQLSSLDAASFQAFLNPEMEYSWIDQRSFRSGPIGRAYFAVNEGHQSDFNLVNVETGWFAEKEMPRLGSDVSGRIDYFYAIDFQGNARFADRHAVTASLTTFEKSGDIFFAYLNFSLSDFKEDGQTASIDSLDGPAMRGGATQFWSTPSEWLRRFRLGGDVSAANTVGSDFRYFGAGMHSALAFHFTTNTWIEPETGIGFRVYDDFRGPVDRDELILRFAVRGSHQLSLNTTFSMVFNYERFVSDNDEFDSERFVAGFASTWSY